MRLPLRVVKALALYLSLISTISQAAPTPEFTVDNEAQETPDLEKRASLGGIMISVGSLEATVGTGYSSTAFTMLCPYLGEDSRAKIACYGSVYASLSLFVKGVFVTMTGISLEFGDLISGAAAGAAASALEKKKLEEINDQKTLDHYNEIWGKNIALSFNDTQVDAQGLSLSEFEGKKYISKANQKIELLKEYMGIDSLYEKIYDHFDNSLKPGDLPENKFIKQVWSLKPKFREGSDKMTKLRNLFGVVTKLNPNFIIFKTDYGLHVAASSNPFVKKQELLQSLFKAVPQPLRVSSSSSVTPVTKVSDSLLSKAKEWKDSISESDHKKFIDKSMTSLKEGFITMTLDISEDSADFWSGLFNNHFERQHLSYQLEAFGSNGTSGVPINMNEIVQFDQNTLKACATIANGPRGEHTERLHSLKSLLRTQVYMNTYGPIDPECHSIFKNN